MSGNTSTDWRNFIPQISYSLCSVRSTQIRKNVLGATAEINPKLTSREMLQKFKKTKENQHIFVVMLQRFQVAK